MSHPFRRERRRQKLSSSRRDSEVNIAGSGNLDRGYKWNSCLNTAWKPGTGETMTEASDAWKIAACVA